MDCGVEFSGFDDIVRKIEALGVSMDEIADAALTAAGAPAVNAFKQHVPYDNAQKDSFHARDHVNITPIKSGKNGRYRIVGVFAGGAKPDWGIAEYLFYVENGTSKMTAKPFIKKAQAAVRKVTEPIMRNTAEAEIQKRLG